MKMNEPVFAIYDSKGGYYRTPFSMRSRGEAVRAFADVANDKTTEIGKHPEDFTLFLLADFDTDTGTYKNQITPISLGLARDFTKQEIKDI
jgi:hypothetical protein